MFSRTPEKDYVGEECAIHTDCGPSNKYCCDYNTSKCILRSAANAKSACRLDNEALWALDPGERGFNQLVFQHLRAADLPYTMSCADNEDRIYQRVAHLLPRPHAWRGPGRTRPPVGCSGAGCLGPARRGPCCRCWTRTLTTRGPR